MSDPIAIALIAAVPTVLSAVAAILASHNHALAKKIDATLVDVHLEVNSRLTALLAATNAQGRQDERSEQRADAAKVQVIDSRPWEQKE